MSALSRRSLLSLPVFAYLFAKAPFATAAVGAVYLSLNLLFASLYLIGGGISGMRPGSFLDAFFFSVQTIATVGYGNMSPGNLYANILTTIEIMTGIFLVAVMAGLIFVRFSRPMAHIVFSRC